MQNKLISIGEALIDFVAETKDVAIKDVLSFTPKVGGAPLNVAGAFGRLGGVSAIITALGCDGFADKIREEAESFGVDTRYVTRTSYPTSLAFVSIGADGSREFSFFRHNAADTMLQASAIKKEWFSDCYCLHFCSVSLGDFPIRKAHDTAIEYAKERGAIISFDPNLRLPLWTDKTLLKNRVLEYIKFADILKLADDEIAFLFGTDDINSVLESLFEIGVAVVLVTCGANGARGYTKNASASVAAPKVVAVDTTGAGDAFIGAFLFSLQRESVKKEAIASLSHNDMERHLRFAVAVASFSVTTAGALCSYPTLDQIENFVK